MYNSNPQLDILDSLKWVTIWTIFWACLDYLTYQFIKPIGLIFIKEDLPVTKKKGEADPQPPIDTKVIPNLKDVELLQNVHQRHVVEEKSNSKGKSAANSTVADQKNLPEIKEKELTPYLLKMRKFERSSWRFINYTMLFVFTLKLYWNESYAFKIDAYFEDWPTIISTNLNIIYAMEVGHYIYAIMVIPLEPKQKDKVILFIHHVSALLLLIGSHCNSYCRCGIIVLLITDISDPILEVSKSFQYMGFQKAADVGFHFFAAIFLVFRNILFPYAVLLPTFGPVCLKLPGTDPLRVLLIVLQFLFFYWSYLILNIAINVIGGRGAVDIRDDDDDE